MIAARATTARESASIKAIKPNRSPKEIHKGETTQTHAQPILPVNLSTTKISVNIIPNLNSR